jgi:hypothetical protein
VTVVDLPAAVLAPKDGRCAKRDRRKFAGTSDLHSDALNLEDVREVGRRRLRDALPPHILTVSQHRTSALRRHMDLGLPACRRTEGIRETRSIALREQPEHGFRVSRRDELFDRAVILLDGLIEIGCHVAPF